MSLEDVSSLLNHAGTDVTNKVLHQEGYDKDSICEGSVCRFEVGVNGSLASSYTNFDDLLAGVANGIEEAVRGVAPQIETRLQVSAEQNVHPKDGRKNGITSAKKYC